jgi:hypothetical protein
MISIAIRSKTKTIGHIVSTIKTHPVTTGLAGHMENPPGAPRATLNRFNGCLKNMIEAIADSKLRRMQRELELGGIRRDRLNGNPVALEPRPAELSRGAN